jgi:hypothetical protein
VRNGGLGVHDRNDGVRKVGHLARVLGGETAGLREWNGRTNEGGERCEGEGKWV